MFDGSRLTIIVFAVIVAIIGFCFGFLTGYFTESPADRRLKLRWSLLSGTGFDADSSARIIDEIKPENIQTFHRNLTAQPHLAGTAGEHEIANYIADLWRQQGLEHVKLVPYEVLLSYPDTNNPNRIVVYDESTGSAIFTTQLVEKILRPEQNQSGVVPPFNVFSPPGNPKGSLVYVNYGRVSDFQWLKQHGIDVNGTICMARYGKIFRGDKVDEAQRFGCIGMILYSDPADYAVDGADSVYPDSWWLPGTGVQRGTIKKSANGLGDPLTPLYPAIKSAYRLNISETGLPYIPVHPIGYDDASVLLRNLTGPEAPKGWQGKLNITYRLGPHFQNAGWKVQMHISTRSRMATTHNVIGYIEGSVEPDRYVIIGNHYDAFVFGAVDPNSGTAAMLEISRVLADFHLKGGRRPRRTIMFCAWGAEEHGIIGSREWVENFRHILGERAVAYLNVDIAVQGRHILQARSLPLLHDVLYDVAQTVPNPDDDEVKKGHETVYDTWLSRSGKTKTGPKITPLGSGSDFAAFVALVGVTSADLRFTFDPSLNISSYPLYHSVYETNHLYETFIDPQFKFTRALGQLWCELARRIAEPVLLPFSVTGYASAVSQYVQQLENGYGQMMRQQGRLDTALGYLSDAVNNFTDAAQEFQQRLANADLTNPLVTRQLNDQMMQLERAFIDPVGLPNRPAIRHVLFAPSIHNSYAGTTFPGLVDSMFGLENSTDAAAWRAVEKQLSLVTFFIHTAAASLAQPTMF